MQVEQLRIEEELEGYSHTLYVFDFGALLLLARSYDDTANEAHFFAEERGGARTPIRSAVPGSLEMRTAIEHLKGRGLTEFTWFGGAAGGYSDADV